MKKVKQARERSSHNTRHSQSQKPASKGKLHLVQVAIPEAPARPRQAKNWLAVNIGAKDAKELRALAECLGMNLRTFLLNAVRHRQMEDGKEIEREFGVKYWELSKITKAQRWQIGAARQAMFRACRNSGVSFPERN